MEYGNKKKGDVQKKLNSQTKIFSQINISNSFDFTGSQPGFLSPEVENSNLSGFTVQPDKFESTSGDKELGWLLLLISKLL